jgi:hypothetical protein
MKIQFSTDGAAFDLCGDAEVRRILEKIADQVEYGWERNIIMDANGNRIGEWSL